MKPLKNAVKRDLVLERLLEQRGTTMSNEEFDAALAYTAQRQSSTPQALRGELGESGLANYRFLLDPRQGRARERTRTARRARWRPKLRLHSLPPPSNLRATTRATIKATTKVTLKA